MYQRILTATDFSESSQDAVRTASNLAKAFQAELILLHVYVPMTPPPDMFISSPDWYKYELAWREAAEPRLKTIVQKLIDPSVHVKTLILSGLPAQTIDKCAADEKADLIVIATHGMTGWRHYVMGSVSQKVIQHSPLPVLLVRSSK